MNQEQQNWSQFLTLLSSRLSAIPAEQWKNGFYIELSKQIFEKTKVLISASTLKRIFGKVKVDSSYQPHPDTREALIRFAGYESWNHFLEEHQEINQTYQEPLPTPPCKPNNSIKTHYKWIASLLAIGCCILFITLFYNSRQSENVSVELIAATRLAPHTAIFQVNNAGSENLMLLFDTDTIPLPPGQYQYNHFFKIPGSMQIAVVNNQRIIKQIPIVIENRAWDAYAHTEFSTHKLIPPSASSQKIYRKKDARTFFSSHDISSFGISNNDLFMTEYRYIQKDLCPSPNFEVDFAMKSDTDLPPVYCEHTTCNLYFEQGRVEFHFVKEGCDRWAGIILKDKILTGADTDLSFMSTDFSQMKPLSIQFRADSLFLNSEQKTIFKSEVAPDLGAFHGLSFHFSGLGKFGDITLKTGDKTVHIPAPEEDTHQP